MFANNCICEKYVTIKSDLLKIEHHGETLFFSQAVSKAQ